MIIEATNIKSLWTIEEGIIIARLVEVCFKTNGLHVAIGGGTLHQGYSMNDLDLIVFKHKSTEEIKEEIAIALLQSLGFYAIEKRDHSIYQDLKCVYTSMYNHKRVDFFFFL